MITEISLENFKSWQTIPEMRFAPITGLLGTNSSGKTSILQWLLMLKQTSESADRNQVLNLGDENTPVQLGTFRDILYSHANSGTLKWTLEWDLPKSLKISDPTKKVGSYLFEGSHMSQSCSIVEDQSRNGRSLRVNHLSYRFADREFDYDLKEGTAGYKLHTRGSGNFKFLRNPGRAWALPAPIKCYGFPDHVLSYHQNAGFLQDFQLSFEEQFARIFYLGPLREYPRRQYGWSGAQPADMGPRGEKVVDALLSSLAREEKISRGKGKPKYTVQEYVAHWLRELGLIDQFRVKEIAAGSNLYHVEVQKTPESTPVLITDVGFGISQILPVIVLCYYVPEGSTLILEQPEIHLHPSVQAGLADIFIDAIRVRKLQIIVETHSEYLFRRLQRRIAEEETLQNSDVALYFCEFKEKRSQYISLDVDQYGNIKNWPRDFFGDEFGEIAATTRAVMQRKLGALK